MEYIRDFSYLKTIDNRSIKPNKFFRSSQLYNLSDEQLAYLKSLNIKRIIDLRNKQETIDEPNIKLDNVNYINISLVDTNLNGVTHEKRSHAISTLRKMPSMMDTYKEMITTNYGSSAIRKVIREIVLNHEYPTLIHCVTGKDRAGVISFIVQRILGVSYKDALNDYYKQRKYYIWTARKLFVLVLLLSFSFSLAKKAYDYYAVDKRFIDEVLKCIDEKFGSFDGFIRSYCGLNEKNINDFKESVLGS